MFDDDRHPGFAPLKLPPKSDGARPGNQLGFTCPDGREWSLLVTPAVGAAPPAGGTRGFTLILTLADRIDGRTRRIGDAVDPQEVHELPIAWRDLNPNYTVGMAIADATVVYWESVRGTPDTQVATIDELKASFGIDLAALIAEAAAPLEPDVPDHREAAGRAPSAEEALAPRLLIGDANAEVAQ